MAEQSELLFEQSRLRDTILLAKEKLKQAKERNENTKSEIISAKKEMRENTSHSISNLWSSEGFEALAELSQYVNPVTDKIADFEEVENKIQILETLLDSPYFARIDFKFEDETSYEKVYIGRASLKKESSYELFVYDWRSPIASVFYRFVLGEAYYDAPGGRIYGHVNLKRQYEIKKGELDYFFDSDVQIVDEFLRKLLSQNTSAKMKTIIETIQKEQDIVIRDMEKDLLMVQGVAGSGKTSIALHRAAYLMYQGLSNKLAANNILIISPNTLFEQYISNVLPELGESNVLTFTVEELMKSILHTSQIQSKNQFLEKLMRSKKREKLWKSSMEFKTSGVFLEILNRFILDIPNHLIPFEDIEFEGKVFYSKEMLRQKIMSRNDVPLGIRLRELPEFISDYYMEMTQEKMHKSDEISMKTDMQAYLELNVIALYKKLISDTDYFYSLTKNLDLISYPIEEILGFTKENLETGYFFHDDAIVLTYLTLRLYGSMEYRNIKQVVIDEAQDYYPLQYEIFALLFHSAKFTVLGDMNQTFEKEEDIEFYERISRILKKKKASLISMDKSFRCTNEILNYSLKFIQKTPQMISFNRHGDEIGVYQATSLDHLADLVIQEIKSGKEKGYQSIGLLCKSEQNARNLYEKLSTLMEIILVCENSTADLSGISIMPIYMAKGLEFDAAFVCDATEKNYHSKEDKKMLYVACTRALHRLNLFYEGDPSKFL